MTVISFSNEQIFMQVDYAKILPLICFYIPFVESEYALVSASVSSTLLCGTTVRLRALSWHCRPQLQRWQKHDARITHVSRDLIALQKDAAAAKDIALIAEKLDSVQVGG